jgi:hypothetical protein
MTLRSRLGAWSRLWTTRAVWMLIGASLLWGASLAGDVGLSDGVAVRITPPTPQTIAEQVRTAGASMCDRLRNQPSPDACPTPTSRSTADLCDCEPGGVPTADATPPAPVTTPLRRDRGATATPTGQRSPDEEERSP